MQVEVDSFFEKNILKIATTSETAMVSPFEVFFAYAGLVCAGVLYGSKYDSEYYSALGKVGGETDAYESIVTLFFGWVWWLGMHLPYRVIRWVYTQGCIHSIMAIWAVWNVLRPPRYDDE